MHVRQILEQGRHWELTKNRFDVQDKHTVDEWQVRQSFIQGRQDEDAESL